MANTVASLFQRGYVVFDRGACKLIEGKQCVSRALGEPEEQITKRPLIDINGPRILAGKACFAVCSNPGVVVHSRRECSHAGSLCHYRSFSRTIFSATSFCASFLRDIPFGG